MVQKRYDKEFKVNPVKYYKDHRDIGRAGCASNLGISEQTLSRWRKEFCDNGEIGWRGSGNFGSDAEKENAKLRKELRDTRDALNILKKAISILGN